MSTKTIQIESVVEKELGRMPRWQAMLYLQEKKEASAYQLAKDLNWSAGKAHSVIRSLQKARVVSVKQIIRSGRALKLVRLNK